MLKTIENRQSKKNAWLLRTYTGSNLQSEPLSVHFSRPRQNVMKMKQITFDQNLQNALFGFYVQGLNACFASDYLFFKGLFRTRSIKAFNRSYGFAEILSGRNEERRRWGISITLLIRSGHAGWNAMVQQEINNKKQGMRNLLCPKIINIQY